MATKSYVGAHNPPADALAPWSAATGRRFVRLADLSAMPRRDERRRKATYTVLMHLNRPIHHF